MPLFTSPRPRPRPESTDENLTSSPVPRPRPEASEGSSSLAVSPRPQPRPERPSSDNDDGPSWSSLGTPELQQPKVREALAEAAAADEDESPLLSVANDLLFGADDPPDPRIDELTPEERSELAFDQRIEAGTAATILGMGTADLVGAAKHALPTGLKFPAQVLIGTGVGRVTFPPMKEAADWYHGEVKDQPIIDPATGIISEENGLDFIPGIVSTGAGLGVQALTTTALTTLGVSNPFVLAGAGLGAGVYGAGKAWVWTDEVAIPTIEDAVIDTLTSGIDVEAIPGVPSMTSDSVGEPVTLAELEALWDEVADQIPTAETVALNPAIGVLAPDHWTTADITEYTETGVTPDDVDPDLEALLARTGLSLPVPEVSGPGTEGETPAEPEVVTAVSPKPVVPVFRTARLVPDTSETPTFVEERSEDAVGSEPVVDVFVADDDDDGPSPQCLVPLWLIPYVDALAALGVRDFCALKDLTPADIEDLLDELTGVPDEPVLIDEGPVLVPVFATSRVDKTPDEADDEDEDDTSVLLLV